MGHQGQAQNNFRVSAEFEIGIGIRIQKGPGNIMPTPIFDSDFNPDTDVGSKLS